MNTLRIMTGIVAVLLATAQSTLATQQVSILQVPATVLEKADDTPEPFAVPAAGDYSGSKSTGRAALYSLILPGLGHYYLGEKKTAVAFFAVEAAIWASFISFEVQGNLREDGYQQFAQNFAGVTTTGHSDDYYSILTRYNSFQDYEDELKREGRYALYPYADAATLERYFVENRVGDYEPWVWRSAELRRAYQDQRSASKRAYRRALYAGAAAVANRVAAVFFSIRSGRSQARGDQLQNGMRIEFGAPGSQATGELATGISVIKRF
jgi:hypothetical protein